MWLLVTVWTVYFNRPSEITSVHTLTSYWPVLESLFIPTGQDMVAMCLPAHTKRSTASFYGWVALVVPVPGMKCSLSRSMYGLRFIPWSQLGQSTGANMFRTANCLMCRFIEEFASLFFEVDNLWFLTTVVLFTTFLTMASVVKALLYRQPTFVVDLKTIFPLQFTIFYFISVSWRCQPPASK